MNKLLTALLSIMIMLSMSCSKPADDSKERKFISMMLDDKIYLSENPKALIYTPNLTDANSDNDYPRMEITGQSYTGDVIVFTLAAAELPFKPGTYPATLKGNGLLIALNTSSPVTLTSENSSNFWIKITRIDNMAVEGTFSGTLTDTNGNTAIIAKDGAFRAVVKLVSE